MNIILEYVLVACAPHYVTSSKLLLPLVKAFMDDVNLMSSVSQTLLARSGPEWSSVQINPVVS